MQAVHRIRLIAGLACIAVAEQLKEVVATYPGVHDAQDTFIIGIPVSILSLFGFLALSGIVVNDSLVLVARIDDLRAEQGMSLREAVIEAGPQRFRAILLTTLTTFIGLVPILLEGSTQAQFLKPMAVSVAFGVVFATAITLVLLPVLMIIVDETFGASFKYYRGLLKGESGGDSAGRAS